MKVKTQKPFYTDWCRFSTGPDIIGKDWYYEVEEKRELVHFTVEDNSPDWLWVICNVLMFGVTTITTAIIVTTMLG